MCGPCSWPLLSRPLPFSSMNSTFATPPLASFRKVASFCQSLVDGRALSFAALPLRRFVKTHTGAAAVLVDNSTPHRLHPSTLLQKSSAGVGHNRSASPSGHWESSRPCFDRRNFADVFLAFRMPRVIRSLHSSPNPRAVAKELAEPNCNGWRNRLALIQNVVKVLVRNSDETGNLGLAPPDGRDYFVAK
jgi:hypothetical protein